MTIRRGFATVPWFAVALGLGTASGAENEGHHKREHHVITIGGMSVHPRTITISADEVIVFANYASKPVQVEFSGDVAAKFSCPIRPTFHETGKGRLASPTMSGLTTRSLT